MNNQKTRNNNCSLSLSAAVSAVEYSRLILKYIAYDLVSILGLLYLLELSLSMLCVYLGTMMIPIVCL